MPTAFFQATKSSVPFILTYSYPSLGHLISRTLSINVIGYTKNFACLSRVSKKKKKQESLLQALIKRDMLLVANCYTRNCKRRLWCFKHGRVIGFFRRDVQTHVIIERLKWRFQRILDICNYLWNKRIFHRKINTVILVIP